MVNLGRFVTKDASFLCLSIPSAILGPPATLSLAAK